jgi:hypothetical protein
VPRSAAQDVQAHQQVLCELVMARGNNIMAAMNLRCNTVAAGGDTSSFMEATDGLRGGRYGLAYAEVEASVAKLLAQLKNGNPALPHTLKPTMQYVLQQLDDMAAAATAGMAKADAEVAAPVVQDISMHG